MSSAIFEAVLKATGYLGQSGQPAPGLMLASDPAATRMKIVFKDDRVGLNADAVFSAQNAPVIIFKDAGEYPPSDGDLSAWHEAAWNIGVAPLLWIVTPTDVQLYDGFSSPERKSSQLHSAPASLDRFLSESPERLRALDEVCGRLATESGAFWSSVVGKKIDRHRRVDRELLAEISALEEKLIEVTPTSATRSRAVARDLAQRFIGRCIFTWYLIDRGLAQPFLPSELPPDLSVMFRDTQNAFQLFDWLRSTFNGDLFPMDDVGAEKKLLSPKHLECIRDFIEGRSLIPGRSGQGRLFRFRFNAIPIELISSIYQQFARTSAAGDAEIQGLHYTPVELVHLTLDPVFEGLPATARIIDPACGSGAFLVEAFRRLVWRSSQGQPASRQLVRQILYKQLFGIDINRSALGIAAFSLYLAALELSDEPVTKVSDLKFDKLIDATLFEADSLGELPRAVTSKSFDAVVGNPPWTFAGQAGKKLQRRQGDSSSLRPRRSPDQAFLGVAERLAKQSGRIGMIMKATPFFSKDVHAVEWRKSILKALAPVALINLSYLRREELFPDAVAPAMLFFSRCALASSPERVLVGSIPWTPDFRRTGVFHVGPGEIRSVPLKQVLAVPSFLKAATMGTVRDGWLISRIDSELPTLDAVLTSLGITARKNRGQGYKVNGAGQTKTPQEYFQLPVLTPDVFTAFRLNKSKLGKLAYRTLHRPRTRSIYDGPLLICSKVGSEAAVERGRFSAAVFQSDLLYSESFTGISFAGCDRHLANVLSGILNSSLTAFQLAFGGPTWGLERPTVLPHDLLSLRIPDLQKADSQLLNKLAAAERAAAVSCNPDTLKELDEAVYDLYDLDFEERLLASDSVLRARYMVFENRSERAGLVATPTNRQVSDYARQVVRSVNAYLRARGERHLQAITYSKHLKQRDLASGIPGVMAVRFVMVEGAPKGPPQVREGKATDIDRLRGILRGQFDAKVPPYLNERRQLRLYGASDLFILKPAEARYWTQTTGLNDADVILADHWTRRDDVAVSA